MSDIAYISPPQNRFPALVAAIALHLGLFALLVLTPSKPNLPPVGSSVPINIVSSEPVTNTRPAIQAPETQTAAAPNPTPQAPPQPAAAELAPPQFSPTSSQAAKAPKPTSTQPSTKPAPTPSNIDWSRMQQMIEHAQRTASAQTSSAARGQARPETAAQARPDAGQGLSESDKAGLVQLLERLWKLNCDVAGIAGVNPQVKFTVGLDGRLLLGPTALGGLDHSGNAVVAIGTRQAMDAVRAATPLPEQFYGETITANFNAKEACAKR